METKQEDYLEIEARPSRRRSPVEQPKRLWIVFRAVGAKLSLGDPFHLKDEATANALERHNATGQKYVVERQPRLFRQNMKGGKYCVPREWRPNPEGGGTILETKHAAGAHYTARRSGHEYARETYALRVAHGTSDKIGLKLSDLKKRTVIYYSLSPDGKKKLNAMRKK